MAQPERRVVAGAEATEGEGGEHEAEVAGHDAVPARVPEGVGDDAGEPEGDEVPGPRPACPSSSWLAHNPGASRFSKELDRRIVRSAAGAHSPWRRAAGPTNPVSRFPYGDCVKWVTARDESTEHPVTERAAAGGAKGFSTAPASPVSRHPEMTGPVRSPGLDELRAFCAAVDLGSVGRAARQLGRGLRVGGRGARGDRRGRRCLGRRGGSGRRRVDVLRGRGGTRRARGASLASPGSGAHRGAGLHTPGGARSRRQQPAHRGRRAERAGSASRDAESSRLGDSEALLQSGCVK